MTGEGVAWPLAVTAARLAALDGDAGFVVGPEAGARWYGLSQVEADGTLDLWLEILVAQHGNRATAGSALGGALTRAVVHPAVAAMVVDLRCPAPEAANLAVRLDEAGDLTGVAVLSPRVAVVAGDETGDDPHSVAAQDEAALVNWWAARTAETLRPLLAAVRARAPFGIPALWGGAADEITSTALWVGQLAGRNPYTIWDFSQRMVEALAARAPVRLARPRPFPVAHPAGERWFQVRGTCCLSYRSTQAEGTEEDRFCSTCPLRDNDSRRRHLYDYLCELHEADPATC